jgi:hypothetical protein
VANHELYKESDTIAFVPRGNAEKLAQAIMKMKQG